MQKLSVALEGPGTITTHVIEGDTDSLYFAVAGNPDATVHQGFEHVVSNREFYDNHVYEWFPDPTKGMEDEKKLGGLAIENVGDYMIAVAPKNYTINSPKKKKVTIVGGDGKPVIVEIEVLDCDGAKLKMKGCSEGRNKQITPDSYLDNIQNKTKIEAENCGFRMKDGNMVKYTVKKTAISGIHTKMIVLENECCAPYIHGLNANDYYVE